jgi:hypothetical protein
MAGFESEPSSEPGGGMAGMANGGTGIANAIRMDNHVSADDLEWKVRAENLAEKRTSFPFYIHHLKESRDITFVFELARQHSYSVTVQNGRAEFLPLKN